MSGKAIAIIDIHRDSILKACQYFAIFLAWFAERSKKSEDFDLYFSIYQKIFHARRLFRLLKTVFYIPQMRDLILNLKRNFTFLKLFEALGKLFTSVFYALDNVTIISMTMGFVSYKTARRISHGILFNGIVLTTVALFIELRQSFKAEAELKTDLQNITPTEMLQKLSHIDEQRKTIAIRLVKAFGDLFPTLARTNLPQVVISTKINKGTVGFFGMISALTQICLKSREASRSS